MDPGWGPRISYGERPLPPSLPAGAGAGKIENINVKYLIGLKGCL